MSAYQAKQPVSRFLAAPTANRATGTVDGTAMVLTQPSSSMVVASALLGRTVTKVVAAVNASAEMIAQSDYQCDGVADEVQINAALAALPASGGTVQLSEGTFTLTAPVLVAGVRQRLIGMGMGATTLIAGADFTAPSNYGVVHASADYDEVSDLTIDGNKVVLAAQTNMRGLATLGALGQMVRRVRVTNSAAYGILIGTLATPPTNSVIRDCQVDGSVSNGFTLRGVAGQPFVASGCTAKNNGGVGFICDNGPVVLSDCQGLSNGSYGFNITSGPVQLSNCTAQNNSASGFVIQAADCVLTGCRSLNNTYYGFYSTGARTQFTGCLSATNTQHGFVSASGATDTLFVGCSAVDNPSVGFDHSGSGVITYVGCQSLNHPTDGFLIEAGEAHLRACYAYGNAAGGNGIRMAGGTNHSVDGCRVTNTAGHGIYTLPACANVQVTNNQVNASSLAVHNTYSQIAIAGDTNVVHGNMLRDPASGNRPAYGIVVASESDGSMVGLNDTYGSGVTAEVSEQGTTIKRTVRLALDYNASTDLLNGYSLAALTWADICADQSFWVGSTRSVVEIAVRGCMLMGAPSGTSGHSQVRLLLDGVTTKLFGSENHETTYYQSPFSGGGPVKFQGLAIGTHTIRVQMHTRAPGPKTAYLRAAGVPTLEFLSIQVVEYMR